MTKIFKIPFATQGDRVSVPDDVQANGSVSYTQGYGYDYERDQSTDPAAKDVEREAMNGLFHDITEAIGEMQSIGASRWCDAGKPYPIRAVVYHKNKLWQSKIENNVVEPGGIGWDEFRADLVAGDVGAYSKIESDKKFQPLGNYQLAGHSYSKEESDNNFQPKGNYQLAGNYANKGDSYTKSESDSRFQGKGSYQPAGSYATTEELSSGLNTKIDKSEIVQSLGVSETKIISQKAITEFLKNTVGFDAIYPVGVVIWFAQNKNPNTLFPGTTWVYIGENKTIRLASSSGNNVLSSGGSDSVTLTTANMPAHNHGFSATTSTHDYGTKTTSTNGDHNHAITTYYSNGTESTARVSRSYVAGSPASTTAPIANAGNHAHSVAIGAHSHTVSGTTSNTGSGQQFSVVNSYVMLMGWYRTK